MGRLLAMAVQRSLDVSLWVVLVGVCAGTFAISALGTYAGKNGRIAFSRTLASNGETRGLLAMNPDGTRIRKLTSPPSGVTDTQPDWSPDGSRIAFEHCFSRCEVWAINADGTGARRIGPVCLHVDPPACEDRSAPAWSPNGRLIAFSRAWGPATDSIKFSELALMNADGRHVRVLTHITKARPFSADVGNAMWSPNGKRLVFDVHNSRHGKPANRRALFTINANGKSIRQLTPWSLDGGDHPDWSPDGRLILFRTVSADEQHGNIYTIHPDGTHLDRLTNFPLSAVVLSYSFSPDGQQIAFTKSDASGTPAIWVMKTNGTAQTQLTHPQLGDSAPDWGTSPPA